MAPFIQIQVFGLDGSVVAEIDANQADVYNPDYGVSPLWVDGFGISGAGDAYYDTDAATPGEEAIAGFDTYGNLVLVKP